MGIPAQGPESGIVEPLEGINAEKEQVVRQELESAGFTVPCGRPFRLQAPHWEASQIGAGNARPTRSKAVHGVEKDSLRESPSDRAL